MEPQRKTFTFFYRQLSEIAIKSWTNSRSKTSEQDKEEKEFSSSIRYRYMCVCVVFVVSFKRSRNFCFLKTYF